MHESGLCVCIYSHAFVTLIDKIHVMARHACLYSHKHNYTDGDEPILHAWNETWIQENGTLV